MLKMNDTETYWAFALHLIREKRWKEALPLLEDLREMDNSFNAHEVLEALGDCYFKSNQNKWEISLGFYSDILDLYSDREEDRLAPVYIKIGKCYEKMKLLDRALENYKLAIEIDPKSEVGSLRLGWTLIRINEQDQGTRILKKGLKNNPDSIELKLFLSQALLLQDEPDISKPDALSMEILEVQPQNTQAMILRARILEKLDKITEAENKFEEAIRHSDGKIDGFFHVSQMYKRQKEEKKAINALKQCIQLEPNHFAAAISLATILGNSGDHHKAAKYFRHAAKIDPTSIDAQFGLGRALLNVSDNKEAAISCFEYVLQKEPSNYKALTQMSIAYMDKQKFNKSFEYIYKSLKLNKKYSLGLVTMGNLLFETGKPQMAIKYHKEAL